jgi:isocitrate/isopropylmalate dehydrogenase
VAKPTIVVLEGDQTGQELLEEAVRLLSPAVIGVDVELERYDLSLGNRRATKNQVVHDAAAAMCRAGFGLKAATITPEQRGDVGSPNAILRKEIDGTVILRTGRPLPGVEPIGNITAPIAVVRMATEDAYEAKEWREGSGAQEKAFRTTYISRRNCRAAAEFSFILARQMGALVFGGPKWTVSPTYEGLLKECMDEAAKLHPDVPYDPQLIDAAYALLFARASRPLVIPCLNCDGDILSDLGPACTGTIGIAPSANLNPERAFPSLFEPVHGSAPDIAGKGIANPIGQIWSGAMMLEHLGHADAAAAVMRAIEIVLRDGPRTPDMGGHATTIEMGKGVAAALHSA